MEHTIYIILAHTGTLWSRIIKRVNKYEYSHVMLSLDDKLDKMYSFGRKKYNNPIDAGFVVEDKNGEFFTKFDGTRCRVYKVIVSEEQYEKLGAILEKFEYHRENFKYDIIGVILRQFNLKINRENHYVCTQFIATVLDKSGIYKPDKPFEDMRPQDFEHIREQKPTQNVYEGLLRNFARFGSTKYKIS